MPMRKDHLTIYASRLLSSGGIVSYKKGEFVAPIGPKHSPEFARLLMGVLSFKRLVLHNYDISNMILSENYEQELDHLHFSDDNEITYRDDSGGASIESDESSYEKAFDTDGSVLQKVKDLKAHGNDIKKYADWEDMLCYDRTKRSRS